MNLRTFLLIDSILLEVAGVALLIAGQAVLGGVLFGMGAIAFGALMLKRPVALSH
jgi:hypothetical protein